MTVSSEANPLVGYTTVSSVIQSNALLNQVDRQLDFDNSSFGIP